MSWLPNPIACDVCGTVKQPSNHWWYAEIAAEYFWMHPWDDTAEDSSKPYLHLCGQVCATRKLNEWMGGSDNPEPRPVLKPDPPPSDLDTVKLRVRRELAKAAMDITASKST